ncbi:MAG: hypothetical protein V3V08_10135, partial [Nannocystaceae bacterium]
INTFYPSEGWPTVNTLCTYSWQKVLDILPRQYAVKKAKPESEWDSSYARMFLQDVQHAIMPIGGRSERSRFKVELVSGRDVDESLVAMALGDRSSYGSARLAPAVTDWVTDFAVSMLMLGAVRYELKPESGEDKAFRLIEVSPENPSWVRRILRRLGGMRSDTSSMAFYEGRMPPITEEQRREIHRACAIASSMEALVSLRQSDSSPGPSARFDVDARIAGRAVALAHAVGCVGWNGRDEFHPRHAQNVYHYIYRQLRFSMFLAQLRATALGCLDSALEEASTLVGRDVRVRVVGLPTEADAERVLDDLTRGQTNLPELATDLRV